MPACRKQLVADASVAVASKAILIGENCHIVADKSGGPRGKSILSPADRDRYPNLILLCANHHTVIDQDSKSWPVELLHQIKSDHEVWVETKLAIGEETESSRYYSQMINRATESLLLNSWAWVCDNAFRCILVEEFVEGINSFCKATKLAIWPAGHDKVRDSLINLSQRLNAYVQHFMSNAEYVEAPVPCYRENKAWKKNRTKNFDEYAEKSRKWGDASVQMLSNIVVALNDFASEVRASLKPSYFLYEGKFTIVDSMGMSTDGVTPAYYIPDEYRSV